MRRLILFVIISFTITACDFSPAAVQARLKTYDDNSLAAAYYDAGGRSSVFGRDVYAELIARNDIPAGDWPNIDQHVIAIGMGPLSVEASWGAPTDVNDTTTADGHDDQWVYRPCDKCRAQYAYFDNGVLSTIQN